MKRTQQLSLLGVAALVFGFSGGAQAAKSKKKAPEAAHAEAVLNLDTTGSSILWHASKVTGKHDGSIKAKSGHFEINKGALTGGNVEVDMGSIANSDIADKESAAKLVGHLSSEDFFDAKKFPTSNIHITKVEAISGAKEGSDTHTLTGDLTLKGVTKTITFPAKIKLTDDALEGSATVKINRTDWGIKYGSGKFFTGLGDKVIHDEFSLDLKLVAKK